MFLSFKIQWRKKNSCEIAVKFRAMEDNIVLTTNELQILSELDSRQFGFIKLSEDLHLSKKTAALKAIQEKD